MSEAMDRKSQYVDLVTRGGGYADWQLEDEKGQSGLEGEFRAATERRKSRILARRSSVRHPTLIPERSIDQARRNAQKAEWAEKWFHELKRKADYLVAMPASWVTRMLPELTPWVGYTFFCPACYGVKSFGGAEYTIIRWDYRQPDRIACRCCGQTYPSDDYPETGALECPRSGQTLTFYVNDEERLYGDDRSGRYAWQWAGHPVHPSFTGIVRDRKIAFMIDGARQLALMYRFSGDARYAQRAVQVLLRLATCFRQSWLYHDYWDTVADCDALYAAWHDRSLPLEWKRNLFTSAYERDTESTAGMLQTFWGAGRVHPSTDFIHAVRLLCETYDLVHDARGPDGRTLWTTDARMRVERDLLLEWMIEAEPFVGGPGRAACTNNKSPRIYVAMAAVARCLGIPSFARTAIQGYRAIRNRSFKFDGFSTETPSYTDMYLGQLLEIPELLHGYRWPMRAGRPRTSVNLYRADPLLERVFLTRMESLRPDGRLLPHGDSHQSSVREPAGSAILEIGLKRFPELYGRCLPVLYHIRRSKPTEYAVFHLDAADMAPPRPRGIPVRLDLPETFFPGWMVAVLRHGIGTKSTLFTMNMSPAGSHRHYDNLAIYYETGGRTILGDHGYLAEAPAQRWVKDTFSHNLVIVDDQRQIFTRDGPRRPSLRMMVTSPLASAVEGSSQVYPQCSDYRRLCVLLKGPDARAVLVDIFRVRGGRKHDYRVFSEIASSDVGRSGRLHFAQAEMPLEPPLPQVGASEKAEDIYGLRDLRQVIDPPAEWQVTWKEKRRVHRMWMLSKVNRCEASNGPGQESWTEPGQAGRRVRYVDAINTGDSLASVFVAVHEPSDPAGRLFVRHARRLETPERAGPDAVAVRLESDWGDYLILNEFAQEAEVRGVRFRGKLGVWFTSPRGWRSLLACGAESLGDGEYGFAGAPTVWSGTVRRSTSTSLQTSTERPAGWPTRPSGVAPYVLTGTEAQYTGFPVRSMGRDSITVSRFPLQKPEQFLLYAVQYREE